MVKKCSILLSCLIFIGLFIILLDVISRVKISKQMDQESALESVLIKKMDHYQGSEVLTEKPKNKFYQEIYEKTNQLHSPSLFEITNSFQHLRETKVGDFMHYQSTQLVTMKLFHEGGFLSLVNKIISQDRGIAFIKRCELNRRSKNTIGFNLLVECEIERNHWSRV